MGITKLADLIRSDAPDAISHKEIQDYSGKTPDQPAMSGLDRYVKQLGLMLA